MGLRKYINPCKSYMVCLYVYIYIHIYTFNVISVNMSNIFLEVNKFILFLIYPYIEKLHAKISNTIL